MPRGGLESRGRARKRGASVSTFSMTRAGFCFPVALCAVVVLPGCGRGSGLAADVLSHLAARGITVRPSRVHEPISRRDGFIVAPYDAEAAASIISALGLEQIQPDTARWRLAVQSSGGAASPKELWGVWGRPSQLRLRDGGQFEHFYLLVTGDGWMVLLAEYAYG